MVMSFAQQASPFSFFQVVKIDLSLPADAPPTRLICGHSRSFSKASVHASRAAGVTLPFVGAASLLRRTCAARNNIDR